MYAFRKPKLGRGFRLHCLKTLAIAFVVKTSNGELASFPVPTPQFFFACSEISGEGAWEILSCEVRWLRDVGCGLAKSGNGDWDRV